MIRYVFVVGDLHPLLLAGLPAHIAVEIPITERPKRMPAPGVREETMVHLRYKENGSAEMTDPSLVRARGVVGRCGVSPLLSMVRDSSATVVSGASRIPFERSSRNRRFPWRCRSQTMME